MYFLSLVVKGLAGFLTLPLMILSMLISSYSSDSQHDPFTVTSHFASDGPDDEETLKERKPKSENCLTQTICHQVNGDVTLRFRRA